jgi:hypothetical protein
MCGEHAVLFLMPHGPQRQIALLNTKRGLGVGQLRVRPPQLLVAPIADVRPQHISPFAQLRPRAPTFDLRPRDLRRAVFVAANADVEQPGRARVLPKQTADAALDRADLLNRGSTSVVGKSRCCCRCEACGGSAACSTPRRSTPSRPASSINPR